jgi:hypothetical protein
LEENLPNSMFTADTYLVASDHDYSSFGIYRTSKIEDIRLHKDSYIKNVDHPLRFNNV